MTGVPPILLEATMPISISCPVCPLRLANTQVCDYSIRFHKGQTFAPDAKCLTDDQKHNLVVLAATAKAHKLPLTKVLSADNDKYAFNVHHKHPGTYVVCFHTKVVGGDESCPPRSQIVA